MQTVESTGTPAMWATFAAVVTVVLALDLGVIHRRGSKHTFKRAAIWAGFCIALAFGFALWIRHEAGPTKALDFTTAYLLEEALSVDNLFVFLILFRALAVPVEHQHRVLFWGILGAILTRGAFIAAGTALVSRFEWIFWIFGAVLVITGIKLLRPGDNDPHPERNPIARLFMRIFPMTRDYRGGAFFVREGGRTLATPLMLAVVAAEATDVVFAVDSIPAVFGITSDPFIVYTSNIFAILGLRSLYTLLAGVMDRFHYLKVGLAFVLIFIGAKMLVKEAFHWQISTAWALLVLLILLGGSIVASLLRPAAAPGPGAPPPHG
jgi:tellurite resistance protein TerC